MINNGLNQLAFLLPIMEISGTFVPIRTGHMPIDFHQKIKYNRFKQQKIE